LRVQIEQVREATPEVADALARLLPQLNPALTGPSPELLRLVVSDPAVALLVARADGEIVGTATLAVVATPTWVTAHVNDVVVDEAARGRGVGRELMQAALRIARDRGAQVVRLTSAERRSGAHRLYASLGFRHTGSRAYRLDL
jgi:ribosomal protein S18 acetylase RimI-like enzyme